MVADSVSATLTIDVPAEVVFRILADPPRHVEIDGTGRVREALDPEPLTTAGQIFRMAMYHENHPDGTYQMANRVQVIEAPRTISWEPGYYKDDGSVGFGGWVWRYELVPSGPHTTDVTLTYDWSAVPDSLREHIPFPPFGPDHLANSLAHLGKIAGG